MTANPEPLTAIGLWSALLIFSHWRLLLVAVLIFGFVAIRHAWMAGGDLVHLALATSLVLTAAFAVIAAILIGVRKLIRSFFDMRDAEAEMERIRAEMNAAPNPALEIAARNQSSPSA